MADPGSDRRLLDRLNALKASSVRLDTSQNVLSSPTQGLPQQPQQPPSKEDALAARLRTLRNQAEGGGASPGGEPLSPSLAQKASRTGGAAARSGDSGDDEAQDDPLFLADEDALNDFLGNLDVEDDSWSPGAGAPANPEDEEKRVAALLERLGKDGGNSPPQDAGEDEDEDEEKRVAALLERLGTGPKIEDDEGHGDDDSEGEGMSREVDDVLAQARDEAELDRQQTEAEEDDGGSDGNQRPSNDESKTPASPPEQKTPCPPEGSESSPPSAADAFSLPSVPSALVDPAPDPERRSADFEDAVASRMAAMKGVGGDAVLRTDDWGLPSAPTFQPADRKPKPKTKPGRGGAGYTDADRRTWCVVCLEDATVRCFGCDDAGDPYCWRCWREMHVGLAAGFDERGHRWVKFEREDG